MEQYLEDGSTPLHFLDSVVLAPERVVPGGLQRWLVVDGQQRLTTLRLAFTALRDSYRERGERMKADHDRPPSVSPRRRPTGSSWACSRKARKATRTGGPTRSRRS
ncbi:DUF262 domain-containing protein [Streptomyces sp. DG2A-72]|uniref:DUF262 domain-containing protein n=1 Tax=Streptomyces sp. DG2A-72 TaxID=3051386 RepID=UPI00265BFA51|nr:DUF262 domain-containing protein [Streptomyces sp. DG2A-72]MDO0932326.1 DUF262 domain-containing protein [Streptomyces sp. DG2A-72]